MLKVQNFTELIELADSLKAAIRTPSAFGILTKVIGSQVGRHDLAQLVMDCLVGHEDLNALVKTALLSAASSRSKGSKRSTVRVQLHSSWAQTAVSRLVQVFKGQGVQLLHAKLQCEQMLSSCGFIYDPSGILHNSEPSCMLEGESIAWKGKAAAEPGKVKGVLAGIATSKNSYDKQLKATKTVMQRAVEAASTANIAVPGLPPALLTALFESGCYDDKNVSSLNSSAPSCRGSRSSLTGSETSMSPDALRTSLRDSLRRTGSASSMAALTSLGAATPDALARNASESTVSLVRHANSVGTQAASIVSQVARQRDASVAEARKLTKRVADARQKDVGARLASLDAIEGNAWRVVKLWRAAEVSAQQQSTEAQRCLKVAQRLQSEAARILSAVEANTNAVARSSTLTSTGSSHPEASSTAKSDFADSEEEASMTGIPEESHPPSTRTGEVIIGASRVRNANPNSDGSVTSDIVTPEQVQMIGITSDPPEEGKQRSRHQASL